jgi:ABC-type sugar transport system permease subunit
MFPPASTRWLRRRPYGCSSQEDGNRRRGLRADRQGLPRQARGSPRGGLGCVFLSPWIPGLLILTVGLILVSLYWSFTEFDILATPKWIGFEDCIRALNVNKVFHISAIYVVWP